jgi:hypothetical protein
MEQYKSKGKKTCPTIIKIQTGIKKAQARKQNGKI